MNVQIQTNPARSKGDATYQALKKLIGQGEFNTFDPPDTNAATVMFRLQQTP